MSKLGLAGLALVAGLECAGSGCASEEKVKAEMLEALGVTTDGVTTNKEGKVIGVHCDTWKFPVIKDLEEQRGDAYIRIGNVARQSVQKVYASKGKVVTDGAREATERPINSINDDYTELICVSVTPTTIVDKKDAPVNIPSEFDHN